MRGKEIVKSGKLWRAFGGRGALQEAYKSHKAVKFVKIEIFKRSFGGENNKSKSIKIFEKESWWNIVAN